MPGRYTDEQRRGIMANRRARGAGYKYGYSMADQGYTGQKENGASAVALDNFHKNFGRFADPTWDTKIGPGGQIMYRAKGNTPDRQQVYGTDWFEASKVNPAIQKSYDNTHGNGGFFTDHPDATFADWAMYKGGQQQFGKQGWIKDPTGQFMVNPNNQFDRRDLMGRRIANDGSVMGQGVGTTNWMGGANSFAPAGGAPAQPQPQTAPPPAAPATPAPPTGPGIPDIGDLNQGIAAGEPAPGTGLPDYGNPYKKRKNLGNLAFGSDF